VEADIRNRTEALAAVRERLDRTAADQDPRWVQGEQALADAGELAAASDLGGDLDAAYMLGMFYWFRFEASGPQAGQDDATVAALFLIPLFASDPGSLPEPLRRLYQQPGGPGGNTDPSAAADRARAQFSAYQGSGRLCGCRLIIRTGHGLDHRSRASHRLDAYASAAHADSRLPTS
jgi:hypothetical protein